MKYRFTKDFKKGDEVEWNPIKQVPEGVKRFPGVQTPDFLEEVKEPEYRYCDTETLIHTDYDYFTVGIGEVIERKWHDADSDHACLEMGEVFRYRVSAEKHLAFLKARAKIKAFMIEKKVDTANPLAYIIWSKNADDLRIDTDITYVYSDIFFNNTIDARECIELYPSELKIVLGVED